jgi:hypothetical protein
MIFYFFIRNGVFDIKYKLLLIFITGKFSEQCQKISQNFGQSWGFVDLKTKIISSKSPKSDLKTREQTIIIIKSTTRYLLAIFLKQSMLTLKYFRGYLLFQMRRNY